MQLWIKGEIKKIGLKLKSNNNNLKKAKKLKTLTTIPPLINSQKSHPETLHSTIT
jgi:hypothetical protein